MPSQSDGPQDPPPPRGAPLPTAPPPTLSGATDWTGRRPAEPAPPVDPVGAGDPAPGGGTRPSVLDRLERRLPPRLIGVSGAAVLVLALLALAPGRGVDSEEPPPPAARQAEPQGETTGRTTLDLMVGECFNAPTDLGADLGAAPQGAAVPALSVVPCEQPHDGEVYAVLLHPEAQGSPYPGQQEVLDFGTQTCVEAFQGFVGIPYEDSVYQVFTFVPDGPSWAAGLRTLNCSVADASGAPITGTARDTAR